MSADELRQEIEKVKKLVMSLEDSLKQLKRYHGNAFYWKKATETTKELNSVFTFLNAKVQRSKAELLKERFHELDLMIRQLVSPKEIPQKLSVIGKLDLFWPKLLVEVDDTELIFHSFQVPTEIPEGEPREDLQEAIRAYGSKSYLSALVMCRRAYEGALVGLYRAKTGNQPVEDRTCPHCGKLLVKDSYIGITKLHGWAVKNGYITEKLKSVGFLLADIGAGGAHPPLSEFPRDEGIANLGINATMTLLREIAKA
ncbi:MAG: hypothetical protein JRN67_11395 [Nitrososphaerota archaeon]|nr:hypothetical protein [Nitrososphaerota archaeon]